MIESIDAQKQNTKKFPADGGTYIILRQNKRLIMRWERKGKVEIVNGLRVLWMQVACACVWVSANEQLHVCSATSMLVFLYAPEKYRSRRAVHHLSHTLKSGILRSIVVKICTQIVLSLLNVRLSQAGAFPSQISLQLVPNAHSGRYLIFATNYVVQVMSRPLASGVTSRSSEHSSLCLIYSSMPLISRISSRAVQLLLLKSMTLVNVNHKFCIRVSVWLVPRVYVSRQLLWHAQSNTTL